MELANLDKCRIRLSVNHAQSEDELFLRKGFPNGNSNEKVFPLILSLSSTCITQSR